MITSGQRTLTKSRIAPHLIVTPAAGESILKLRFRREALSPADKSAALRCCGVCCLRSLMHLNQGSDPQNCPFHWGNSGPHPTHASLGQSRVFNPYRMSTIESAVFWGEGSSLLCSTGKPIKTDHTTSVARGCIFALCECDVA